MPSPARDPFDRLESAAEAVARRVEATTARVSYERANRLGLLWTHGVVGVAAGLQMLLFGTATTIETIFGPQARIVMGPLAFLGGTVLILGLTRHPRRSIPMEAVGLALLATWDLLMTAGLAYARWHQHEYHVLALNERLPQGYVSAYPIAVYGGMFALLSIHLWTLRILRRDNKEECHESE